MFVFTYLYVLHSVFVCFLFTSYACICMCFGKSIVTIEEWKLKGLKNCKKDKKKSVVNNDIEFDCFSSKIDSKWSH